MAAVAALFLASCTGGGGEGRTPASPTSEYWHGETLRVAFYPLQAYDLDPKSYTAAEEMRLATRYDTDGDGRCDVAACARVPALLKIEVYPLGPPAGAEDPWRQMAAAVATDLRRIGVQLDVRAVDGLKIFRLLGRPEEHVAVGLNLWWAKNYPNASTFFATQFHGECIGRGAPCFYPSLVGASHASFGPGATTWPACRASTIGSTAACRSSSRSWLDCWAELDRYVLTPEAIAEARVSS